MWLYKEIISFNDDQTKVRFWESQSFEFRDDSPNKLTDKVTVVSNFPLFIAIKCNNFFKLLKAQLSSICT